MKCLNSEVGALLVAALVGVSCASSAATTKPVAKAPEGATNDTGVSATGNSPAKGERERPEMRKPEWLPDEVREMLSQRMQRHSRTMVFLLMDVVTLSHEDTVEEAEAIADEPRFGRPAPGEKGTISALLPARFFELEDQLRVQAKALAAAARASDDARLVRVYGELTQTCVSCHTVYLTDDGCEARSGD
jgi:hypothetical protein